MINRKVFFDSVRAKLFGSALSQAQVDGISAVLDEWEKRKLTDLRWLAYMLATDKHETNATMQPVREAYWLSEEWRRTHLRYYPYYGRGLPQLTWQENYRKMTIALRKMGIDCPDLVLEPDAAMRMELAVPIMFEGMMRADTGVGDFTGKSLDMFFDGTRDDPIGARAIVNGSDKALLIAGYHQEFLKALQVATVTRAAA